MFEQRPVIKSLVAEKSKPWKRMCDVYREACFCKKKIVHKWPELFKEGPNSMQDKDWLVRL